MENLLLAFKAFHINGAANIAFVLKTSLASTILIVSCLGTIVLKLKDAVERSVREEQKVL